LHPPLGYVKLRCMTGELGLRARKKLERRRCIESAALELFETNGFDGTTVEDIAAAADIAPRTFFYYFATKEDVVLADYATRLARITEVLEQQPSTIAPWAALRAAFVVVASDYTSQRVELVRRFVIMADNPSVYARSLQLQAGWEDTLARVLADRVGTGATDVLPRLMAASALACMRSSLQHWLLTGHRSKLPALLENCFDTLAKGFATV
jgi:AcrR family transcriptional regulator